jgi:polyhydroxyalkanoic acid synthase PhaR subunit
MSQNQSDGFDPNDPLGAWRSIRDANLDAWAKGMASFVNTESFAKSLGLQLDSMLAASAPVQQAMQEYMERYLAQVNMPSRGEVVSLATRMTNIELRLDDMQAQLDELLAAVRDRSAPPADATSAQLDELLAAVRGLKAAPAPAPVSEADAQRSPAPEPARPARTRRTRKPAEK